MSDNQQALEIQALQQKVLQLEESNRELRETDKKLRSIISQSVDGIVITNEQGELIEWNPSMEAITGIPAAQVLGEPFWEVQYQMTNPDQQTPEILNQLKESINGLLKTGQAPWLGEQMVRDYLHPDGSRRFIQGAVFPIQTDRGFMLGSISRDVSERKRAEEALQKSQERAQHYLDIAGVMLIALDTQQRVTLINPKGCQVLGYSQSEILGENWFDKFLPSENINQVKQVFNQVISGEIKPVEYYENPILSKDGEQRLIAWHNSILYDQSGSVIGLFSSGEDITELKETQFELERHQKHLEELVAERTEKLQKMINLMAGREVRMAELKKVIKALRAQLKKAGLKPVADDPLLGEQDG